MEIQKLSEIGGDGSYGVTLSKDNLRERGLIDDIEGSIEQDQFLKIKADEDAG